MWLRWSVCFHLPLGCPLIVDHRSHLTCEKMNHRGCYLSVHLHDSSHHEIVHQPSHWDDEEDGCACRFSCMVLPPCYPLFLLTFPMTLGVLLHRRGRRSRFASFSDLPNVSVHLLDVMVDILHDHRVLFSFERPSFAVLLLNVRWWTFDSWMFRLLPSDQGILHTQSFSWWLGWRLLSLCIFWKWIFLMCRGVGLVGHVRSSEVVRVIEWFDSLSQL